jgi:hypothetical protein
MPYNQNPFTQKQERFLKALKSKLIEIRDPDKEVLDHRSFEFYVENTKKLGAIPKIRFRPSCMIKEEIMKDVGYKPVAEIKTWKDRRNAAASAFDKYWDNLVFRLVKAGKMLATFNQMLTEENTDMSELIFLVQRCIVPEKVEHRIINFNQAQVNTSGSYIEELDELK